MLIILPIIFLVLLFVSNQQKRKMQELQDAKSNSLEIGEIISTYSGIVGKVVDFDEKYIKLESSESTFVILKEAIANKIDSEVEFLESSKNNNDTVSKNDNKVELQLMEPKKKSARDEYGF